MACVHVAFGAVRGHVHACVMAMVHSEYASLGPMIICNDGGVLAEW